MLSHPCEGGEKMAVPVAAQKAGKASRADVDTRLPPEGTMSMERPL
jgi:hypothetical protein